MAQAPSQQIQVIPQPLSSAQLQQLYMPQQHIILPGNVTLQQGGTLTSSPGMSLQIQPKPSDSKTMGVQNIQPYPNTVIIQPKPAYSTVQNHVLGSHVKQPRTSVASPAPGTLYSHPQLLGSYALSPLPPGYTWASSPSSFPCSQSPIIISREQPPNIYVQSQSQSAIQLPVMSGQFMAPTSLPCSQLSQGVQSIATQTIAPSSLNSGTISYLPQVHNVETSTSVVNSTISQKLTQPSLTISSLPSDQPSAGGSETVAPAQTETAPAENVQPLQEVKPMQEESLPAAEVLPAAATPVDAGSFPASSVPSAVKVEQPVVGTEELSSEFIPQGSGDNKCHEKLESPLVQEMPKKPIADVKPVPEKANSSANVPESIDITKHSTKLANEQKMARFNPVIKLKRLKPHDAILTPYARVVKDKQPQKAIVKPQMLSHVIDSYVIQEVTLKSVVDSSSTDISESSNSEDKNEAVMPSVSNPSLENPAKIVKDAVPERKEHLPAVKGRGRGRPRGRGRSAKKSTHSPKKTPTRRSSRQKVAVPVYNEIVDIADEEDNRPTFPESSSICPTDDENFPPMDTTDSDLSFDISTLAAVSSEIGKTVADVHKKPPDVWSVQEVFEFVQDFPGCLEFAEAFKAQEIDGQALLLMNLDHLMTGMSMKLGPALKLIAHISSMKDQSHQGVFEAVGGRACVPPAKEGQRKRRGRPPKCSTSPHQIINRGRYRNAAEMIENRTSCDEIPIPCEGKSLRESPGSRSHHEPPRRRRGRPRKKTLQQDDPVQEEANENSPNLTPVSRVPSPMRTEVSGESGTHQPTEASLFCDISNLHPRRRGRSLSRVSSQEV